MIIKIIMVIVYVLCGVLPSPGSKTVMMSPEVFRTGEQCEKRKEDVESLRKGAEVVCTLVVVEPEKEAKK